MNRSVGDALRRVGALPDRAAALARYRAHAAGYDASARFTGDIRARTIARLGLQPGERVLDIACGTGLSFGALAAAVGEQGRVIGIEQSPEMAALARARVARDGFTQVDLIEAPVEELPAGLQADAVLVHFAHDVLRSPRAIERIIAAARPGARVALAGMKYPRGFLGLLDPWVRVRARPYMTTFEGLARPWDRLLPALAGYQWRSARLGIVFIGWGRLR